MRPSWQLILPGLTPESGEGIFERMKEKKSCHKTAGNGPIFQWDFMSKINILSNSDKKYVKPESSRQGMYFSG